MAGLNEHGYRTDPGYQILSIGLIARGGVKKKPPNWDEDLEEQPRPIKVRWDGEELLYIPIGREDRELVEVLSERGFGLVEAIVVGPEEPEVELVVKKEVLVVP